MIGYPACGTCGHHTSGVVAGRCTSIVPTFHGDGPHDFTLGYCDCRCVDDPVVVAWLAGRGGDSVEAVAKFVRGEAT